MKPILFFLMAVMVNFSLQAQKIKVKKGEILLDGKAIAKIERKKSVYRFSDLSGAFMFSANITRKTKMNNELPRSILRLTGENGNVKEMNLPEISFTLSAEKFTVESVLMSNTGLLSINGIDKSTVDEFFREEDRSISKSWDDALEKDKIEAEKNDRIAKEHGLQINKFGEILANGNKIGFFVREVKSTGPYTFSVNYFVTDLQKNQIAMVSFDTSVANRYIDGPLKLFPYDNKEKTLDGKWHKSDNTHSDELAQKIANTLYGNGYLQKGDMTEFIARYAQEKADERRERANERHERDAALIKEAKDNSVLNIYNVAGYVIDKSGDKNEGEITIEFESVYKKLGKEDNSSYGKSVTLKTVDGKVEFFRARDGVKFCAGERCFLGVSFSALGVLTDNEFLEISFEKGDNYVLNRLERSRYYLKLKNQEKAIDLGDIGLFGTKSVGKIKKTFSKYVNCSALDFNNYDTNTKKGLIQLVEDYETSCGR